MSRALRTAIPTLGIGAGVAFAATTYALLDRLPQESHVLWLQLLLIAVSFAGPALVVRALMLRRRGTGSLLPPRSGPDGDRP